MIYSKRFRASLGRAWQVLLGNLCQRIFGDSPMMWRQEDYCWTTSGAWYSSDLIISNNLSGPIYRPNLWYELNSSMPEDLGIPSFIKRFTLWISQCTAVGIPEYLPVVEVPIEQLCLRNMWARAKASVHCTNSTEIIVPKAFWNEALVLNQDSWYWNPWY